MNESCLPIGRAPTTGDVYRLVQQDVTANACWKLHQYGDLTWEQCLMAMALTLADQNRCLLLRLAEQSFRAPPPVYVTKRE